MIWLKNHQKVKIKFPNSYLNTAEGKVVGIASLYLSDDNEEEASYIVSLKDKHFRKQSGYDCVIMHQSRLRKI